MKLTGHRKNDVALALGAVASCTAIGLAGYCWGFVALGPEHQRFVDIIDSLPKGDGYLAVKKALSMEDAKFITEHCLSAAPIVTIIIGVILCSVGLAIAIVNSTTTPLPSAEEAGKKGKWATGVSFSASVFLIGGSAMIAFGAGILAYACGDVVQPSSMTTEAIVIAAGVTGALALVCFAVDFYLNNKEPAPQL